MAVALRLPGVARGSPAALAIRAAAKLGREQDSVRACCARPPAQCWRRSRLLVRCQTAAAALLNNEEATAAAAAHKPRTGFTVVMKFGGSSLASADRMREVADLILSFPEETPVIVLSAMGKTTNNLLLVLPFLARRL